MAVSDSGNANFATTTKTLQVGSRISQGASRGTIRFIGQVPPTHGTWLGVEWDDATRGKHDGTHNGTRYFTCRATSSTTAASFIRPNASKISSGSSFLQALRYKYVATEQAQQGEGCKGAEEAAYASRHYTRKNLADIEVEAPNMEGVRQRMARLDRLRDVGLGGWTMERDPEARKEESISTRDAASSLDANEQIQVARAYDFSSGEKTGDITKTCPNIRWLDLSRSLLPTWAEVAKITRELPLLDTLALHFNRFAVLDANDSDWRNTLDDTSFSALKDLRLDGTLITWPEMCLLATKMPALESLQLGANELSTLTSSETFVGPAPFATLRQLNLADNKFADWESLLTTLSKHCPRLERLILSGNQLSSIPPPPAVVPLPSLQHISLADNALSSWKVVDNLNAWFPSLRGMVISSEACFFNSSRDDARSTRLIIIARMNDSLEVLNQARINAVERRDAELFYISTIERETAGMSETQRRALHPQWAVLSVKHGNSTTTASQTDVQTLSAPAHDNATTTLRSKLLTVRIRATTAPPSSMPPYVVAPAHLYKEDGVEVKLLTSTPLRLLQGKIARSLGVPGGAKGIRALWALLSVNIDPQQATAVQLRREMRPLEHDDNDSGGGAEERIVYALDNLDWDLAGYNFSLGDELVVVVADAAQ